MYYTSLVLAYTVHIILKSNVTMQLAFMGMLQLSNVMDEIFLILFYIPTNNFKKKKVLKKRLLCEGLIGFRANFTL